MTRSYEDYLHDMLDAAQKARAWAENIDLDAFIANAEKVFAATRALEIIGEAARHVPQDVHDRYPDVPWADMIGMRNVVTHGYFGVDNRVIWRTIQEDLPPLCASIQRILDDLGATTDGDADDRA